jgi:Ca2+/Na+ antiporter
MIEEFIYQVLLVALIVAMWIDVGRLHKRFKALEEYVSYVYYLLYYQYYSSYAQSREEHKEEEKEEAEDDRDAVKEACVVELVGRRGCVAMEEVVTLCSVSKSFVINKLYRRKKLVKVDREYKTVCPK